MPEKPPTIQKSAERQQKSFDVLASIRLYKYDLEEFGQIRPETRQRVYDEELSYIGEGINRPLYTEFVLQQEEGRLVYFHEGQWRPYIGSLINNLELANQEAAADPRRQFLAERAAEDLTIGYQIAALEPGQKLAFKADFPQTQSDLYGEEFIGQELGFQPARKMGFLYQAERTTDGNTVLRSQTVDGNDQDAYAAAMDRGRQNGSIEDMREAYDQVMQSKYGGWFYAGRRVEEDLPEENAWSVILRNKDLIEDYFLTKIEELAAADLSPQELEISKKRLTYGVWAALKQRLDEESLPGQPVPTGRSDYSGGLQSEVSGAYQAAASRGEVLFGCGGAITGENAILQASSKEVFGMIFENKKKWFGCYYCGAKQYGDPCAPRLYCPACTAEVKNGKVISAGRRIKKGFLDILSEELSEWNRRYDMEKAQKQLALQAADELKSAQRAA